MYGTYHDPKIYPHTEFGIPTSNYIQICSGLNLARTETRGQGHSDLETVGDSPRPKLYLLTKYGTATINNIGDLLWVHFFKTWLLRSRSQWLKTVSDIPWPQHISTNWIWGLICHIIWDMLLTLCFACCRWVVLSVNWFCLHTTVMLTVCYINRQPGRGYHYSEANACGESAAILLCLIWFFTSTQQSLVLPGFNQY